MQIPFCVVVGWFMGQPMDLNFKLFETATLFITVLVVAFMLQVCPTSYPSSTILFLCLFCYRTERSYFVVLALLMS